MNKIPVLLLLLLLSLFTAIIFSSTVLGFLNAYTPVSVMALFVLSFALSIYICLRFIKNFFPTAKGDSPPTRNGQVMNITGYTTGAILFIVLLFLPLALWPFSQINPELAWDAGVYHLPRAAELVVSHSLLDMTISYGEYPSGYETLIAFSLLLNHDGYLIGLTHALIMAFFVLATFFLCIRFSNLPEGLLFFIVVFVFASYDLARFIESNPFSWLRLAGFTIGKNDFFISAGIIALLAFSPVGPKGQAHRYSLAGIVFAGFLIAATKPNGLFILVTVVAITFGIAIRQVMKNKDPIPPLLQNWAAAIIVLILGLSWAIRNLVINRVLFTEDVLAIQEFSIFKNLFNPFFYRNTGIYLQIVFAILLLTIIAAAVYRKVHWTVPVVFFILLLSFAITPSTAFWGSTGQPAEIAWRFGIYLLVFLLPALLLLLDPLLLRLLHTKTALPATLLIVVMVVIAVYGSLTHLDRLKPDPQNAIVLRDQYPDPVGTDGYYSAYDYVRQNIHNSIVWVENGMPFYVFGEGLSNSISRKTPPDYWVFFQTAWNGLGGFPARLDTPEFVAGWELLYQDQEGRVYKNKARD